MRNLAHAIHFEMPAIPFVLEKNLEMCFDEAVFEPLNYKNHEDLLKDFSEGKEIRVRYSVHFDRSQPYKAFKIKYDRNRNLIIGEAI